MVELQQKMQVAERGEDGGRGEVGRVPASASGITFVHTSPCLKGVLTSEILV